MLNTEIDRTSYVPFYIQVMDALKEYMEQGDVKAGEQLPGEPELCRMFDVSRTVIRQALKELAYEGLIEREKGRGTFVAEPKIGESLFQELTGFYQDMEAKGHGSGSKVLKQKVVPASIKVAKNLEIESETPVIQIDRLRFVQDEPIVLVKAYLPYELYPGLLDADLEQQSLYAFLEREYKIQIARSHRIFEAVPANEYEADLLQVQKGAPLILLDSVSSLADGTRFEYYHALHRGDRSRFEVDLVRAHEGEKEESGLPQGAMTLSSKKN